MTHQRRPRTAPRRPIIKTTLPTNSRNLPPCMDGTRNPDKGLQRRRVHRRPRFRTRLKDMEDFPNLDNVLSDGTSTGHAGLCRLRTEPGGGPDRRRARVRSWSTANPLFSLPTSNQQRAARWVEDPRVVRCVDDPHPPYSFVKVQGTPHSTGEDPGEFETPHRLGGSLNGRGPRAPKNMVAQCRPW